MFIIQCPILWYVKVCALPSARSSSLVLWSIGGGPVFNLFSFRVSFQMWWFIFLWWSILSPAAARRLPAACLTIGCHSSTRSRNHKLSTHRGQCVEGSRRQLWSDLVSFPRRSFLSRRSLPPESGSSRHRGPPLLTISCCLAFGIRSADKSARGRFVEVKTASTEAEMNGGNGVLRWHAWSPWIPKRSQTTSFTWQISFIFRYRHVGCRWEVYSCLIKLVTTLVIKGAA